jgi:peptidoglycan/LPS O-acetylase OafA/YrhL
MQVSATLAVRICTGALAVLIAASGWFYTFYSRSAGGLAGVEQDALNRRRVRLRRFGGCAMMALGICFFAGFNAVDVEEHPGVFEAVWVAVCILLVLLLVLAALDLRLTMRLRRQTLSKRPPGL